jgi:hypothetical protein
MLGFVSFNSLFDRLVFEERLAFASDGALRRRQLGAAY